MASIWTRRGFWMGGGAVAAAIAAFGLAPRAMAFHRDMGTFGGHHHFGAGLGDPEAAKDRIGAATEWMLKTVDGTDEQKQAARRISDRLVDELTPMAERRKALHEALVRELAKPEVDRAELERLRQEGVKLADDASKSAVAAMGDFATVLTPEQRGQLVEWAQRVHGH